MMCEGLNISSLLLPRPRPLPQRSLPSPFCNGGSGLSEVLHPPGLSYRLHLGCCMSWARLARTGDPGRCGPPSLPCPCEGCASSSWQWRSGLLGPLKYIHTCCRPGWQVGKEWWSDPGVLGVRAGRDIATTGHSGHLTRSHGKLGLTEPLSAEPRREHCGPGISEPQTRIFFGSCSMKGRKD